MIIEGDMETPASSGMWTGDLRCRKSIALPLKQLLAEKIGHGASLAI